MHQQLKAAIISLIAIRSLWMGESRSSLASPSRSLTWTNKDRSATSNTRSKTPTKTSLFSRFRRRLLSKREWKAWIALSTHTINHMWRQCCRCKGSCFTIVTTRAKMTINLAEVETHRFFGTVPLRRSLGRRQPASSQVTKSYQQWIMPEALDLASQPFPLPIKSQIQLW